MTITETSRKLVVEAIVETYRVTTSFEERINIFLDQLLTIQAEYKKVNDEWRKVNEVIDDFISECRSRSELTILLLSIDGLVNAGEKFHQKMNNKVVKRVLPSVLTDIENNLGHIKEIRGDIKLKISDLPELLAAEGKLIKLGF